MRFFRKVATTWGSAQRGAMETGGKLAEELAQLEVRAQARDEVMYRAWAYHETRREKQGSAR